jgi:sporulation protein YlmC with PRC-barrel domain
MLKMKKISESYDMRVFTDAGEYFGDVEESILTNTKIFGWKVRATKNSFLNKGKVKFIRPSNPKRQANDCERRSKV